MRPIRNARARLRRWLANSIVRLRTLCANEGLSSLGRILGQHGLRGGVATVDPTPAGLALFHCSRQERFQLFASSLPGLALAHCNPHSNDIFSPHINRHGGSGLAESFDGPNGFLREPGFPASSGFLCLSEVQHPVWQRRGRWHGPQSAKSSWRQRAVTIRGGNHGGC